MTIFYHSEIEVLISQLLAHFLPVLFVQLTTQLFLVSPHILTEEVTQMAEFGLEGLCSANAIRLHFLRIEEFVPVIELANRARHV